MNTEEKIKDELYEKAKAICIDNKQGSVALLSRRLKIGYLRASFIIDQLENDGIIESFQAGRPRKVLIL